MAVAPANYQPGGLRVNLDFEQCAAAVVEWGCVLSGWKQAVCRDLVWPRDLHLANLGCADAEFRACGGGGGAFVADLGGWL
jgi:hypothetical protein